MLSSLHDLFISPGTKENIIITVNKHIHNERKNGTVINLIEGLRHELQNSISLFFNVALIFTTLILAFLFIDNAGINELGGSQHKTELEHYTSNFFFTIACCFSVIGGIVHAFRINLIIRMIKHETLLIDKREQA